MSKALDNPMSPRTKGLLVVGGGVVLLGAAITAGVLLSKKSAATTTTTSKGPGPVTAPGSPGGKKTTKAVWVQVSGDAAAESIYLQPGNTYAISIPATDPMLKTILSTLPATGVTRSPAGNVAPTGFPNDGRGTTAFRAIITVPGKQVALSISRNTLSWIQKIESTTLEPIITA